VHLVQSRFEQHRRLFDHHKELGERNRPEPRPSRGIPPGHQKPPSKLHERLEELGSPAQRGGGGGEDKRDFKKIAIAGCTINRV